MNNERDYKEEYIRTKTNETYRKYEDTTAITISPCGKSKLNISIHPYLKDEYKKILGRTPVSDELEKFIKKQIEDYYQKKVILK